MALGVPSPQHSTCTFSTVHGHRSGSRLRSKTPVEVGVVLKQPPVSIASTTDTIRAIRIVMLRRCGGLQYIALQVQRPGAVCLRDAGVADQHVS